MCGTSEPVWVRRSTFVVRVGGGTKADRHWLCRGTTMMPGGGEVQADRRKTEKMRRGLINREELGSTVVFRRSWGQPLFFCFSQDKNEGIASRVTSFVRLQANILRSTSQMEELPNVPDGFNSLH